MWLPRGYAFLQNALRNEVSHLYFAVTETNGTIGDSRKSTPSPLASSQKTIHQEPTDRSARASALSANRLNPNPTKHPFSLYCCLLSWLNGTQQSNVSTGAQDKMRLTGTSNLAKGQPARWLHCWDGHSSSYALPYMCL